MGETLSKGTVLQAQYEITGILNTGRLFGCDLTFYKARNLQSPNNNQLLTIQELITLAAASPNDEKARQAFDREAGLLTELQHPAIPQAYDYFTQEDRSYLVMSFTEGQDLETILQEQETFMAEEEVLTWAIELCDCLHYLHNHPPQPVIFRDLKPSKVMVGQDRHIYLIDFSSAIRLTPGQKELAIGTEGYSPPEQYKGIVDPRSDIYALGATLHHVLTKRDPREEFPFTFHEEPPRLLNPALSQATNDVIMKALAYVPEERYPSALALKEALVACLEGRQMDK